MLHYKPKPDTRSGVPLAWDRDDDVDAMVRVFLLDTSGELRAHVKPSCSTPYIVTRAHISRSRTACAAYLGALWAMTIHLHSRIVVD